MGTTVAGLGSLVLIFEGGPDSVNDFEVAGEDLGATAAGWADNFALNMLVLGGSDVGRIRLVDNYDNRSGSEALYVHSLVLAPATTIDLNDLNLYFLKDAQAKQLFGGDANLDGCVDGLDYNLWSLHYRTTGGWTEGNFNADVFVDGLDYDVWSLNYLSGYGAEAAGVPEAGALVLLGVGAMAFIRQRRR
jgi:hypothetical protein